MIPFIEVSHLASSTSFYSGIFQPLGLRYTTPPEVRGQLSTLPTSVAYCVEGEEPILELRQTENPLKPPRLTSLLISAPSRNAVSGFHYAGTRADPPLWSLFRDRRGLEKHFNDLEAARQGPWQNSTRNGNPVTRALLYDLDGNRVEVVHCVENESEGPAPRILDWTFDVEGDPITTPGPTGPTTKSQRITLNARKANGAGDTSRSVVHKSHARSELVHAPPPVPRSHAPSKMAKSSVGAISEHPAQDSNSPRQSGLQSGLNTTTVVGALLGAAAGAALTYGFVSNSRDGPPEEFEKPRGHKDKRASTRRATFPDKPVTSYRRQSFHETGVIPMQQEYRDHKTPRNFAPPDFSTLPIRNHYVDVDADAEYGKDPWAPIYSTERPQHPPAQSVAHRSRAPSHAPSRAPSRSRAVDDSYEPPRSRHSSRSHVGRAPSVRARSEAPSNRVPMRPAGIVNEYYEGRPHAHSRRNGAAESIAPPRSHVPPKSRRSSVFHEGERDTYVSARTHRSPVREIDVEYGGYGGMRERSRSRTRSRPSSHVGAMSARIPVRGAPSIVAPSRASARRVPLPMSGIGSSHAGWEATEIALPMSGVGSSLADWEDDVVSLAPSDSISCIGSKSSRKTRRQRH